MILLDGRPLLGSVGRRVRSVSSWHAWSLARHRAAAHVSPVTGLRRGGIRGKEGHADPVEGGLAPAPAAASVTGLSTPPVVDGASRTSSVVTLPAGRSICEVVGVPPGRSAVSNYPPAPRGVTRPYAASCTRLGPAHGADALLTVDAWIRRTRALVARGRGSAPPPPVRHYSANGTTTSRHPLKSLKTVITRLRPGNQSFQDFFRAPASILFSNLFDRRYAVVVGATINQDFRFQV